ncbi:MAG TPA: TlyA family rRNA (cytidine-2'-O)-methyltransferase [Clostridiales bacterium]|nr:TlyA family rRNA (cytidine-2'-O)-methyltransferase [Clostridiales bacterium]
MKKRIDVLLVEKGLAKSREKAKALIIAGGVYVNGGRAKSPSDQFDSEDTIEIKGGGCPYVSRGGLKLKKAIDVFSLDLTGKVCADIGASTGGFTDCMLQEGAAFVYAVDVGYGQFDWGLRNDGRVEVLERTNARYLEAFDRAVEFVSIDVSFISLALIFPAALRISMGNADIAALIKPQFEAGREKVGKKGVVREAQTHREVIKNVQKSAASLGLSMAGLTYSPVRGPNGNIEFLARFVTDGGGDVGEGVIADVVAQAHEAL